MKKRFTAILCAFVLLSFFAGCGENANGQKNNKITGTWNADIELPDQMITTINGALNAVNPEFSTYIDLNDLEVCITLQFKDDGTYSSCISKASLEKLRDDIAKKVSTGFNEFTRKTVENLELDVDVSTLPTISEESISAIFIDELLENIVATSKQSGFYKAENGKLYTAVTKDGFDDEKYEEYQIEDDNLVFTASNGMGEDVALAMEGIYPLTYTKVK